MKYIIRIFLFLIITGMAYACFPLKKQQSETLIVPLSDTVKAVEGALVYGLPRSVFTVKVEMERTVEVPGPYSRYAGDLLGLDHVIQNETELWSIVSIAIIPSEELDPSEYYVVKSNNLFYSNILALKKEGLILDLNPALFNDVGYQTEKSEQMDGKVSTFDLGSDEYFQVQRDTAYRRVNVDSIFARIPYIVEKKRKLSLDQLAERAARQLMEMREGKHLILTGEATVFPQDEAPIREINRIEKQYTELFTGKSWTERKMFTYQIIPEKNMIGKRVNVFRYSELTGPLPVSRQGGITVSVEMIPEMKTLSIVRLNNQNISAGTTTKYDKLFYRVPDVVNVKLFVGDETIYSSRKLIYQFGEVIQLPANYIIGK